MEHPVDSIPDSQGHQYCLQLNVYRYILQRYYQAKVVAMFVVCLHPDNNDTAFVDEVPVMHDAVRAIMKLQREMAFNCSRMTVHDTREADPLGGTSDQQEDWSGTNRDEPC